MPPSFSYDESKWTAFNAHDVFPPAWFKTANGNPLMQIFWSRARYWSIGEYLNRELAGEGRAEYGRHLVVRQSKSPYDLYGILYDIRVK